MDQTAHAKPDHIDRTVQAVWLMRSVDAVHTLRAMGAAVLGLGNVLMGDDAFGPHVVHALRACWDVSPVEVLDLGTPGLDLIPFIAGLDLAVFVDTVGASGAAGEIRVYDREALLAVPPALRLSPHDPTLKDALLTADLAGAAPRSVVLVGAIPERISTGTALSSSIAAAVPRAVERVVAVLREAGFTPRARAGATTPPAWWE